MVLCTPPPCAHCLRSSPLPRRLADAQGQPVGPNRVWLADAWIPGLAMSRAIGDIVAHTVGVSSGEVGVAGWWDLVWTQQMGAMVAWAGAQRGTTDPGLHKPCHGAEPETSAVELCPQDKWLVLATDGVWEFIDPQVWRRVCEQPGLWSRSSLLAVPAALVVEPAVLGCGATAPGCRAPVVSLSVDLPSRPPSYLQLLCLFVTVWPTAAAHSNTQPCHRPMQAAVDIVGGCKDAEEACRTVRACLQLDAHTCLPACRAAERVAWQHRPVLSAHRGLGLGLCYA